ncbi:MAG: HYExAFE family protein [Anaerohalosphaeraceae bacterium]|nr:HYExAFE family protein [Anaerohalosphaeraceae bacterium]
MRSPASNHYARAFASFLKDNFLKYIPVDQQKRAVFAQSSIKSFDYIFYSFSGQPWLAEVKGRKFKGKTFANLANLQNWVTAGDIQGLGKWSKVFGPTQKAVIVFVYCLENIDVDPDGREIYEFGNKRYIFIAAKLEDYCKFMTPRSRKWDTVSMPAEAFRQCAVSLEKLF